MPSDEYYEQARKEMRDVQNRVSRRDALRAGAGAIMVGTAGCLSDIPGVDDGSDVPVVDGDGNGNGGGGNGSQQYPEAFRADSQSAVSAMEREMSHYNEDMQLDRGYRRDQVNPDSVSLSYTTVNRPNAIAPRYEGTVTVTARDAFADLTEYPQKDHMDLLRSDLGPAFLGLMYPSIRDLREHEVRQWKPNQEAITAIDYIIRGQQAGRAVVDLSESAFDEATEIYESDLNIQDRRRRLLAFARERITVEEQGGGQNQSEDTLPQVDGNIY